MNRSVLWVGAGILLFSAGGTPKSIGAQLRTPNLFPRPSSECRGVGLPDADMASFVRARTIRVSTTQPGTTYVRIVSAGNRLALRMVGDASILMRVRMFAKLSGDATFLRVCRTAWTAGTTSSFLTATMPWQGDGSVWRVELTVEGAAKSRDGEVAIDVLRAPNGAVDIERPAPSEGWNDAAGFLCVDDLPAARFQKRSVHGFSGKVRLDIDTEPSGIPMSSAQERSLKELVLRAVSIWVQGCAACRIEHLVMVRIDGRFFVRSSVVDWYERRFKVIGNDASSDLLETELKDALEPLQVLQPTRAGEALPRSKMLSPYVEIPSPAEHFRSLCDRTTNSAATALSTIRNAACFRDALPPGDRASIRIRFREGATYCGDNAEIIACRADRELTEYNIRDFRFDVGDDAAPIGHGDIELDLLMAVVHEMGHWIGLGHINRGESVMANNADAARCIDFNTISTLVRTRETNTITTPLAFRLHRPKRQR